MRSSAFDPIQILEIFMTVGGIPYYLDKIRKGRSAAQNVDGLSFVENAALRNEFGQLYAALFEHHDATFEDHRSVLRWVKPLARTRSGPSWVVAEAHLPRWHRVGRLCVRKHLLDARRANQEGARNQRRPC
jgi:hypothetical protein